MVTIERLEAELNSLDEQYKIAINQATAVMGAKQFVEALIKDVKQEQNGADPAEIRPENGAGKVDDGIDVSSPIVVPSGNTGG